MRRADLAKRMMYRLMKRAIALWSAILLSIVGVFAATGESGLSAAPTVSQIRMGVDAEGTTRIVLDMDADPRFEVRAQRGGDAKDPGAIIISLPGADLSAARLPRAKGLVSALGLEEDMVVARLGAPALPKARFVIPPSEANPYHRLVIDLSPVSAAAFAASAQAAPEVRAATAQAANTRKAEARETEAISADLAALDRLIAGEAPGAPAVAPPPTMKPVARATDIGPPPPSQKPKRPTQRAARRTSPGKFHIVIDPGHGGFDPGAIGSTGLKEKHVTLAAAQKLSAELERRGYLVTLTRNGDDFVDLEDRLTIARDVNADLFMSLHADANPVPTARGASVYTLSEERSASMANELVEAGDFHIFDVEIDESNGDVSQILFDLASTDTKNQSSALANALVSEMRGVIPMVNNTHRRAGLQVLLSPDVPAVLVELAFLSNVSDEANLASLSWRRRATLAVADGIDQYFAGRASRYTARGISSPVARPQ